MNQERKGERGGEGETEKGRERERATTPSAPPVTLFGDVWLTVEPVPS